MGRKLGTTRRGFLKGGAAVSAGVAAAPATALAFGSVSPDLPEMIQAYRMASEADSDALTAVEEAQWAIRVQLPAPSSVGRVMGSWEIDRQLDDPENRLTPHERQMIEHYRDDLIEREEAAGVYDLLDRAEESHRLYIEAFDAILERPARSLADIVAKLEFLVPEYVCDEPDEGKLVDNIISDLRRLGGLTEQ